MTGNKKAMIMATGLRPPQERTKDLIFLRGLIETGTLNQSLIEAIRLNKSKRLIGMLMQVTRKEMW